MADTITDTEETKAAWLATNYNGNWEMWVSPVAIYDDLHQAKARVAELESALREILASDQVHEAWYHAIAKEALTAKPEPAHQMTEEERERLIGEIEYAIDYCKNNDKARHALSAIEKLYELRRKS